MLKYYWLVTFISVWLTALFLYISNAWDTPEAALALTIFLAPTVLLVFGGVLLSLASLVNKLLSKQGVYSPEVPGSKLLAKVVLGLMFLGIFLFILSLLGWGAGFNMFISFLILPFIAFL